MIRPARSTDLDALYRLERLCFGQRRFTEAHVRWILGHPHAWTAVVDEGGVRGSVMLLREGDRAHVLSIAVDPAHRRKGLGTRLMAAAEDRARTWKARTVVLEVAEGNPGALAFYRALGYVEAATLPGYYSWGEDALRMRKDLE